MVHSCVHCDCVMFGQDMIGMCLKEGEFSDVLLVTIHTCSCS